MSKNHAKERRYMYPMEQKSLTLKIAKRMMDDLCKRHK